MEIDNDGNNAGMHGHRESIDLSFYSHGMTSHGEFNKEDDSSNSLVQMENIRETDSPCPLLIIPDEPECELSNVTDIEISIPKVNTSRITKKVSMDSRLNQAKFWCEWNMCTVVMENVKNYFIHVDQHVATIDAVISNNVSEGAGHICCWRDCEFMTYSLNELKSHTIYHGFHAKIKGVGAVIMKEQGLECPVGEENHNVLPHVPESFVCSWSDCKLSFLSAQLYYWHVQGHVFAVQKDSDNNNSLFCNWANCSWKGFQPLRLREHSRTHTQEKVVACPKCGSLFSGINKFVDHCRLMYASSPMYVCSYCDRSFSSDRLLQDHVRFHISILKCPQCQMTCTTQSELETHIIYRHQTEKKHTCQNCSKSFKSSGDLVKHMAVHSSEPSYACAYDGCSYSCRSLSGFNYHVRRRHEDTISTPYLCHICSRTFHRGYALTKHLKIHHKFQWPAGHARFRYSKGSDGYLRLQTTRYESIELARQLLRENQTNNECDSTNLTNMPHREGKGLSQSIQDDDIQHDKDVPQPRSPRVDLSIEDKEFIPEKEIIAVKSDRKNQDDNVSLYMCHICKSTLGRGHDLTRHLKNLHEFRSPSVDFKFRYTKHTDGYMRLQIPSNLSEEYVSHKKQRKKNDIRRKSHTLKASHKPLINCSNLLIKNTNNVSPLNEGLAIRESSTGKEKKNNDAYSYMCHICENTFMRGADLKKHLLGTHRFEMPHMDMRFRFSRDSDGFLRLHESCIKKKIDVDCKVNDGETTAKYSGHDDPESGIISSELVVVEENTKCKVSKIDSPLSNFGFENEEFFPSKEIQVRISAKRKYSTESLAAND